MPSKSSNKRDKLIDSATSLAYRSGFGETSIADVAHEADVPLGNVYFYFKTKAELGEAVVAHKLAYFDHLKSGFEVSPDPKQRLIAYIRMTEDNKDNISERGCPVGTFCSELAKETSPLAEVSAQLFKIPLAWITAQFSQIVGQSHAAAHAIQLMSSLQGISELAHVLREPKLVTQEAQRLSAWIETL